MPSTCLEREREMSLITPSHFLCPSECNNRYCRNSADHSHDECYNYCSALGEERREKGSRRMSFSLYISCCVMIQARSRPLPCRYHLLPPSPSRSTKRGRVKRRPRRRATRIGRLEGTRRKTRRRSGGRRGKKRIGLPVRLHLLHPHPSLCQCRCVFVSSFVLLSLSLCLYLPLPLRVAIRFSLQQRAILLIGKRPRNTFSSLSLPLSHSHLLSYILSLLSFSLSLSLFLGTALTGRRRRHGSLRRHGSRSKAEDSASSSPRMSFTSIWTRTAHCATGGEEKKNESSAAFSANPFSSDAKDDFFSNPFSFSDASDPFGSVPYATLLVHGCCSGRGSVCVAFFIFAACMW